MVSTLYCLLLRVCFVVRKTKEAGLLREKTETGLFIYLGTEIIIVSVWVFYFIYSVAWLVV